MGRVGALVRKGGDLDIKHVHMQLQPLYHVPPPLPKAKDYRSESAQSARTLCNVALICFLFLNYLRTLLISAECPTGFLSPQL